MSQVRALRSGTTVLPDFFEKVATEGDATRFVGSETGYQLIIRPTDTTLTNTALTVAPVEEEYDELNYFGNFLFTLPFQYIVGAHQLVVLKRQQVYVRTTTPSDGHLMIWPAIPKRDQLSNMTNPPDLDLVGVPHFDEVSSTTVRLYNVKRSQPLMFVVPHTAIPPIIREKVTVRNQGDNAAIELLGKNDGILVRSPNGSRFLIRVDDSGNLVTEPR
jgi:hypothetical protein